jgi:membrane protein DedA with SNARE-associated domain
MNRNGYRILPTSLFEAACVIGFFAFAGILCGPSVDIAAGRDPRYIQTISGLLLVITFLCLIARYIARRYRKGD